MFVVFHNCPLVLSKKWQNAKFLPVSSVWKMIFGTPPQNSQPDKRFHPTRKLRTQLTLPKNNNIANIGCVMFQQNHKFPIFMRGWPRRCQMLGFRFLWPPCPQHLPSDFYHVSKFAQVISGLRGCPFRRNTVWIILNRAVHGHEISPLSSSHLRSTLDAKRMSIFAQCCVLRWQSFLVATPKVVSTCLVQILWKMVFGRKQPCVLSIHSKITMLLPLQV